MTALQEVGWLWPNPLDLPRGTRRFIDRGIEMDEDKDERIAPPKPRKPKPRTQAQKDRKNAARRWKWANDPQWRAREAARSRLRGH